MSSGIFINRDGYKLTHHRNVRYFLIFSKPLKRFRLDLATPLTWKLIEPVTLDDITFPVGTQIQPDKDFITDIGSTPRTMELCLPSAKWERPYLFHDSGYKDEGLYIMRPGEHVFRYIRLSRRALDRLLRMMIESEEGGPIEQRLIHLGVRVGGWLGWWRARKSQTNQLVCSLQYSSFPLAPSRSFRPLCQEPRSICTGHSWSDLFDGSCLATA